MDNFKNFALDFGIQILKCGPMPKHIAFICDGNRRYAKDKGIAKKDGWSKGAEPGLLLFDICQRLGIKELSFFAFGIENIKRSKEEVDTLHDLFREYFYKIPETDKVRFWAKGEIELAPEDLQLKAAQLFEKSSKKKNAVLDINMNGYYSSMFEFTNSIDRLFGFVKTDELKIEEINMSHFEKNLWNNLNSVDLLVRTSGEIRFSDYLLWQCNYAHLAFVDCNWPELNLIEILKIFLSYQTASIKKKSYNYLKGKISAKHLELFDKKETERFKNILKNPICKFNDKFRF